MSRTRAEGVRDYYEQYWSEEGFHPQGELAPETRRLLDRVVPDRAPVVDVGCGDGGGVGQWALERGSGFLGLDVAEAALARARMRGLRVQRIEDAGRLPLADSSVSVITCLEVFEHLLMPLDAAREIRRVLSPDGLLIASVPNIAYWIRRVELTAFGRFNPYGDSRSIAEPWRDPHVRFFTRHALREMLKLAGFDSVNVMAESHQPFSLRTRLEGSAAYLMLMRRWPSVLAPTLLVVAR